MMGVFGKMLAAAVVVVLCSGTLRVPAAFAEGDLAAASAPDLIAVDDVVENDSADSADEPEREEPDREEPDREATDQEEPDQAATDKEEPDQETAGREDPGQEATDQKAADQETADQEEPSQEEPDLGFPVFRLYDSYTGLHHYTASRDERNGIVPIGWSYEGIGWRSPSSGDAVYRLHNPHSGEHFFTSDAGERDSLVSAGWSYEDVAWYSCSRDVAARVPVYRQYNPNSGLHNYTLSEDELRMLVEAGWVPEGVAWYGLPAGDGYQDEMAFGSGLISVGAGEDPVSLSPAYRLYLPATGEHLFTANKDERNSLASWLWHYEGVAWQVLSAGNPVYRLFNGHSGEHFYTTSPSESGALVHAGWRYEGICWYSGTDEGGERVPVYRVYNPNGGMHFYTMSESERNGLIRSGWRDEGVAWYERAADPDYEDDLDQWKPSISGDAAFDTQLEVILYFHGSLRSAYDYVVGFPYISGSKFYSDPHFLPDSTTIAFAQEMISQHGGNCYRFASLFCWLARGLGYDARVVSGWVPSYSGGSAPHGWVEITIDGRVYIFDPDMAEAIPSTNWYMRTYDDPPTNYGSW